MLCQSNKPAAHEALPPSIVVFFYFWWGPPPVEAFKCQTLWVQYRGAGLVPGRGANPPHQRGAALITNQWELNPFPFYFFRPICWQWTLQRELVSVYVNFQTLCNTTRKWNAWTHQRGQCGVSAPIMDSKERGWPHSCSVSLSVVPLHLLMWWRYSHYWRRPAVRAPAWKHDQVSPGREHRNWSCRKECAVATL